MRAKTPVAIGLCFAFLTILSVLHLLEPEFNPPHFISEYKLGRFGWLMSLAFFCLGAASFSLCAAARREIHTRPRRFRIWGLFIIGVAYFCAGIFPPDPKWFVGSVLHGIGGLVVILGSPIAFTPVSKGLRAQRSVLNGRTTPDLDCRFHVAELGVVLWVQRRFSWCAAVR
jgi:hypothetical protein